jgi:hypothetical protein
VAAEQKKQKRPYYGGGMPKGAKTAKTLEKEALRAELRRMVGEALGPMTQAQIANAQGIKYLVAREVKSGKFIEVSEEQVRAILSGANDTLEMLEVWEKQPNVQAFTDLMNRTIDKPVEQVTAEVTGGLVIRWQGEE